MLPCAVTDRPDLPTLVCPSSTMAQADPAPSHTQGSSSSRHAAAALFVAPASAVWVANMTFPLHRERHCRSRHERFPRTRGPGSRRGPAGRYCGMYVGSPCRPDHAAFSTNTHEAIVTLTVTLPHDSNKIQVQVRTPLLFDSCQLSWSFLTLLRRSRPRSKSMKSDNPSSTCRLPSNTRASTSTMRDSA